MNKSLLLIAVLFAGFVLHGQSPVSHGVWDGDKVGLLLDFDRRESITLVSGCVPASKFQLTFTVSNPSKKDMVEVIVATCSKKGTWGKPKRRFYSVMPEMWGR